MAHLKKTNLSTQRRKKAIFASNESYPKVREPAGKKASKRTLKTA